MYTPIQLEAIKLFGRKDLAEGCIIRDTDDSSYVRYAFDDDNWSPIILQLEWIYKWQYDDIELEDLQDEEEWEILWHIPQLSPDLFRVFWNRWDIIEVKYWFTNNWIIEEDKLIIITDFCKNVIPYNPTIPLLDQPNLAEILNLFK